MNGNSEVVMMTVGQRGPMSAAQVVLVNIEGLGVECVLDFGMHHRTTIKAASHRFINPQYRLMRVRIA